MPRICEGREFGTGRQIRAAMFLRGLKVETVAESVGWSKDKLYRVLRDDRALTDEEYDRIVRVLDGANS